MDGNPYIDGAVGENPEFGRADIQEDDSASGSATPRELTLPMEFGCSGCTLLAPVTYGNDDSAVSSMPVHAPLGPRRDLAYMTRIELTQRGHPLQAHLQNSDATASLYILSPAVSPLYPPA